MDGHWKFRGGGGAQGQKFLKKSMKLNWNFLRGGGLQSKKNYPLGRHGYISRTTPWNRSLTATPLPLQPIKCLSSSVQTQVFWTPNAESIRYSTTLKWVLLSCSVLHFSNSSPWHDHGTSRNPVSPVENKPVTFHTLAADLLQ